MQVVDMIRRELNVEPIINAAGTKTKAGGTWLNREVVETMAALTNHFYVVRELSDAVGRYVAAQTGAEAGCVTSGAGSAMVVAAAACMAGRDPARIRQLPMSHGLRSEIVIHRVHQGQYSHMFSHSGATLVEIGHLQRTHREELRAAIGERTAAVAYLCGPGVPDTALDLEVTCRIAHEFGVPVIVDAAAMLPPRANLRAFIDQGADLVAISGGKVIGGPQASGLLFGRRDLIEAAVANSSPEHSIGRAHKISKEQIVGLYVALRRYLERTDDDDERVWAVRARSLASALTVPADVLTSIERDDRDFNVPAVSITFGPAWPRDSADVLCRRLLDAPPRIFAIAEAAKRRVVLNPVSLRDEEVAMVAHAVSRELRSMATTLVTPPSITRACPGRADLLHSGLLRSVSQTPEAIAVRTSTGDVSYAELDRSARRVAAVLKSAGIGIGDQVALRLGKSSSAYSALVGVLYAGAIYVPLHSLSPDERVKEQLRTVRPAAVLFGEWCPLAAELALATDGPLLLVLEGEVPPGAGRVRSAVDLERVVPLVVPIAAGADDVAYIMFTSGSTGSPKAVPITHRSVRFFLEAMSARYDFEAADRFSQLFDFAFDLSVFDLFVAWDHGASVCAPAEADMLCLPEYATRNAITIWFSVPSAAALVMKRQSRHPHQVTSIRLSLFCGEPLPWGLVDDWTQFAPATSVENLYGPTELTIACTAYRCSDAVVRDGRPTVPIGKTWPGMTVELLDVDAGRLVAGSGRGVLAVTGPQRFAGYLGTRPDAQPFVSAVESGPELFYLTGDLVERDDDGTLHFLGRNDSQVKLDGLRVDLAEIEAVACDLYGASAAAALVEKDALGLARSVSVAVEGALRTDRNIIMEFRGRLPASWCPRSVRFVDEIPRNANGKVNRMLLADGEVR